MGKTIIQKIIETKCDGKDVQPGDLLEVRVDLMVANDMTGPVAISQFKRMADKVHSPDKLLLMPEHYSPAKDIMSAQSAAALRKFSQEQGSRYLDVGQMGIDHVLVPESGLLSPGDLYVNADSHTCTMGALGLFAIGMGSTDFALAMATGKVWIKVPHVIQVNFSGRLQNRVCSKDLALHLLGILGNDGANYRVIEMTGDTIDSLTMDERMSLCNMAVEAGAKSAVIPPDEVTRKYLKDKTDREGMYFQSDEDAVYERVIDVDASAVPPMVSKPHLPANTAPVGEVSGIRVDQVVLGACGNGRILDLEQAASMLAGRKIAPWVRMIVIPGSPKVFLEAVKTGLAATFLEAGATISTPNCGPCMGTQTGVLSEGEICLTTTPRNFKGRMGHKDSFIYIGGPWVAAATALKGEITDPREI
ncbi:MAG: 3-isopropylmalate dehydratase large subunit [Desulfotignum sp.]|nr:3-isopropylmalate dehydratase large subunit [Desulfotignum sp.]MCF8136496.1 3-isopropylmalate dehydratase large subunit [Desulfotignum sp.]